MFSSFFFLPTIIFLSLIMIRFFFREELLDVFHWMSDVIVKLCLMPGFVESYSYRLSWLDFFQRRIIRFFPLDEWCHCQIMPYAWFCWIISRFIRMILGWTWYFNSLFLLQSNQLSISCEQLSNLDTLLLSRAGLQHDSCKLCLMWSKYFSVED